MRAKDLMSQPAVTCHVNDPLSMAAHLMWDHDCGALAVVNDEGKLTGMITDRDICMATFTQGRAPQEILVNNAMSTHVIAADPETPIAEVEERMAKHQIRRVPIVDAAHRPIGIVSLNDLALESAQPDTRMKQAATKVTYTLAAVCRHRSPEQKSA